MIIKNTPEFFECIRGISLTLRNEGYEEHANSIDDALSISMLPLEILGETKIQLNNLIASKIAKKIKIEGEVKSALKYIKNVW